MMYASNLSEPLWCEVRCISLVNDLIFLIHTLQSHRLIYQHRIKIQFLYVLFFMRLTIVPLHPSFRIRKSAHLASDAMRLATR